MRTALLSSTLFFIISMVLTFTGAPLPLVFLSLIATLILTSNILGHATEELSNHYSPAVGGLLNATFGNLAELVICFFALQQGLVEVVKASLTGSIIGNVLFVFGGALFVGGIKKKILPLKHHEARVSSTMLLITVLLLTLPSMLGLFHEESHSVGISMAVALALIILYGLSLLFSFYTHKEYFLSTSHEKPSISKSKAFTLLFFSIALLLVASEQFAHHIAEIAERFGFGELFIGAFLVGIAGNAAEHLGALKFAAKNKMSLVLSTTIGSSLQVAMFVAPVLVFISYWMGNFMNLVFLPIEIVSLFAATLLINEISGDLEVNWFEGVLLMMLYVVLGVLFFFHP